jgi:hypothetical protein
MKSLPSPPHRLRDVQNVERYVNDAIDLAAPSSPSVRRWLHAHGVQAVIRVERALPPGVPLTPVLDEVLPARLQALDRMLGGAGVALAAA